MQRLAHLCHIAHTSLAKINDSEVEAEAEEVQEQEHGEKEEEDP